MEQIGKAKRYYFSVNNSETTGHFNIEILTYTTGQSIPAVTASGPIPREEIAALRDQLDHHLGNNKTFLTWPPATAEEMQRAIRELQLQIAQMENPN